MLRFLAIFLIAAMPASAQDSIVIKDIYNYALTKSRAYEQLDYLCNKIGHRLTGTTNAQKAVEWAQKELIKAGADSVWLQPCKVDYWDRGEKESGWMIVDNERTNINICALGGSIATAKEGLEAGIIEIKDFEDLEKLDKEFIAGKIVFINRVMNPANFNPFTSYGECGMLRYNGAKEVARYGAVGVIVRSLTVDITDYPHTGAMGYVDSIPKIPACAVSTRDAEKLSKAIRSGRKVKAGFKQSCKNNGEVISYNVIAEIRGREYPSEIIIAGAHLDSWDLAQGAHDNGTGVVQSMDLISTYRALNLTPKRTIRCVLFMNEENGGRGSKAYAAAADSLKENHIAAVESDRGGFTPSGFIFKGDSLKIGYAKELKSLLEKYSLRNWETGYAGTDIGNLEKQGTLLIGYSPDPQRYFDIHHNGADTFDKVSKRELVLGSASIASMVWLISEHGLNKKPEVK